MLLDNVTRPTSQQWRQAGLGFDAAATDAFLASVNADAFHTITWGPQKQRASRQISTLALAGHQLSLPLPGRIAPVKLQVNAVLESNGTYTYSGTVDEPPGDWFSFSWDGKSLLGVVRTQSAIYVIHPVDKHSGQVTVARLEPAKIPQDLDDMVTDSEFGSLVTRGPQRITTGTGHVKVLFLYAADVSYANLYANAIVAQMNAALQRSGVAANNYISLAGLRYIPSAFYGQCKHDIRASVANRVRAV